MCILARALSGGAPPHSRSINRGTVGGTRVQEQETEQEPFQTTTEGDLEILLTSQDITKQIEVHQTYRCRLLSGGGGGGGA
jgi:hypothetical protein